MSSAPTDRRPRPRARIIIDPGNAYARLGVSPLASTDDIRSFINERRSQALARRRSQGREAFGEEDAEITRLQEIEEEIGTARARAIYDADYPQNELLTVQPSQRDRWLEPRRRAQLAASWLREELGPDALLLSPDSPALWLPRGLGPELEAALAAHVHSPTSASPATPDGTDAPAAPLNPDEL